MKNVEIPNADDSALNEYWRGEFERLYKIVPNFERKNLIPFDNYFLLATAKNDIYHAKNGNKNGWAKTRRIVQALQQYVNSLDEERKRLDKMIKRQKICVPQ